MYVMGDVQGLRYQAPLALTCRRRINNINQISYSHRSTQIPSNNTFDELRSFVV